MENRRTRLFQKRKSLPTNFLHSKFLQPPFETSLINETWEQLSLKDVFWFFSMQTFKFLPTSLVKFIIIFWKLVGANSSVLGSNQTPEPDQTMLWLLSPISW